jgi:hypothetical protein
MCEFPLLGSYNRLHYTRIILGLYFIILDYYKGILHSRRLLGILHSHRFMSLYICL